jgi:hypothetical protein
MNARITPRSEPHFNELHTVLGAVAREKRFLAMTEAPPLADTVVFFPLLQQAHRVDGQFIDSHAMALLRHAVV